jgi:hypothetical protein
MASSYNYDKQFLIQTDEVKGLYLIQKLGKELLSKVDNEPTNVNDGDFLNASYIKVSMENGIKVGENRARVGGKRKSKKEKQTKRKTSTK